jgi:hypothetical protein
MLDQVFRIVMALVASCVILVVLIVVLHLG